MNHAQETAHEKTLRALLWRSGLRFRKNVASLPGKPDIVFTRRKVVVFCDGDFWHGRNWQQLSAKLNTGANPTYWLLKIKTNRERDLRTDKLLQEAGWMVLRYWETDIHRCLSQHAPKHAPIGRALRAARCHLADKACILCRLNSAPGEIRTPDLLIRSQSLYPAELRAHTCGFD
jgi:DNA mismatch endonuclease (patch repair protein)